VPIIIVAQADAESRTIERSGRNSWLNRRGVLAMTKHLITTTLVGLALLPFAATSLTATPLGATAAAIQPDNALVELVAKRGGARSGGRAHIAGTQRGVGRATGVVGTRTNVASRNTSVASRKTNVVNRNTNVVNRTANVNVNRAANVNVRPGGYVRPANYRWRPGGAIAAGAAIGVVTATAAAAWAGAAPAPGYCWFYTDPSRTKGFWDACP